MFYIILFPVVLIITVIVYVFWQASVLFITTKIFKVTESTYKKALVISLKIFLVAILIGFLYEFLQPIKSIPLAEIIGGITGIILLFIAANYLYHSYYQTTLGKNIGIFIVSSAINTIVGMIVIFLLIIPTSLLIFSSRSQKSSQSQLKIESDQPSAQAVPQADSNQISNLHPDWKKYNIENYAEVQYPSDYQVNIESPFDGTDTEVDFIKDNNKWEVHLVDSFQSGLSNSCIFSQSENDKLKYTQVDSVKAQKNIYPDKNCGLFGCTNPFVTFMFCKDKVTYWVYFLNTTEISKEQQDFLDLFRILK